MFLLNIAADDACLITSGMLFQKRLPRNHMESMPNVMLFAACSYFLIGKTSERCIKSIPAPQERNLHVFAIRNLDRHLVLKASYLT